jgi:hypothetical protein
MPSGGPGRNQGRRPGSVNVKSRQTVEQALAKGVSPIEVMLDNMRFYHQQAGELVAKLITGGLEEVPGTEENEEKPHSGVIEAVSQVLGRAGARSPRPPSTVAARASPTCGRAAPRGRAPRERLRRHRAPAP